MATTTPFPFRDYAGSERHLSIVIDYEESLGDSDKATDTEGVWYHTGRAEAFFEVLVRLLDVEQDAIDSHERTQTYTLDAPRDPAPFEVEAPHPAGTHPGPCLPICELPAHLTSMPDAYFDGTRP